MLEGGGAGGERSNRTFSLAVDGNALAAARTATRRAVLLLTHGGATVGTDGLRVWMGDDPPAFDITIPIDVIASVERLPDGTAGRTVGAHGVFARWIVAGGPKGLVRVRLRHTVKASLAPESHLPLDGMGRTSRLLKPLFRNRTTRVRELTVSLAEPGDFVETVESVRAATGGTARTPR